MPDSKTLVLIDGHSLLYRAFHAYPPLTTPDGELVNAVYGFTSILLNVIKELEPTHLTVAFDRDKPTFRHTDYVGYKAQREAMPTDLASQQKRVEEVVDVLNIPIIAVPGYEADDVLGTIARISQKTALDQVLVVTSDMDILQLVNTKGKTKVKIFIPKKGKSPNTIYNEKAVAQKYSGLTPSQIPDLKGLAGDPSDNLPGVRGIGPGTAIKLLNKYATLENIYKNIAKIPQDFTPRIAKLLIDGHDNATLSKKLATIITNAPLDFKLKNAALNDYNKQKAVTLFNNLGFKTLVNRLPNDIFEQSVQEALL